MGFYWGCRVVRAESWDRKHQEERLKGQGGRPWLRRWQVGSSWVLLGPTLICPLPASAPQSIIRVVFHDRRLQYTEHQQLEGWRWSRPGDRILDIGEFPGPGQAQDAPAQWGSSWMPSGPISVLGILAHCCLVQNPVGAGRSEHAVGSAHRECPCWWERKTGRIQRSAVRSSRGGFAEGSCLREFRYMMKGRMGITEMGNGNRILGPLALSTVLYPQPWGPDGFWTSEVRS